MNRLSPLRRQDCNDPSECIRRIRHHQNQADTGNGSHPNINSMYAKKNEAKANAWIRRLHELGSPPRKS